MEPSAWPAPALHSLAVSASWVVLAISATIGAEPMYFLQNAWIGPQYITELPTLLYFHAALMRPLVGDRT